MSKFLRRALARVAGKPPLEAMAAAETAPFRSAAVTPKRIGPAAQWARLNEVIGSAVASATSATQKQATATQKLDLAQYGLLTLMDDLAAVMTVPGRRERATVVRLTQPSGSIADQALAA